MEWIMLALLGIILMVVADISERVDKIIVMLNEKKKGS